MARVDPLETPSTPEFAEVEAIKMATLGFVPNSARTLARWPELADAYGAMSAAIANTRHLPEGLADLVFLVASKAAGCRYCQAHSAHVLVESGIATEKLQEVWEFESSKLFTDAERAALRLALAAGAAPPFVTDEHFVELRRYFNDDAIVEIAGVIAFSGFMNRWNEIMATDLEDDPFRTAEQLLAPMGWTIGPHGG